MNGANGTGSAFPTVVLDPGHGGAVDAGGSRANNATGPNGLLEKDLTLAVVRAAARALGVANIPTRLTREDDRNPTLSERASASREHQAGVFVSAHFNGHPDTTVDGTEVCISPKAPEGARQLAVHLLRAVAPETHAPPRGVRMADFAVLTPEAHLPQTAACLIELAFLTNPTQAQRLAEPAYTRRLGEALAQGIIDYIARPIGRSLDVGPAAERMVYTATRDRRDPPNPWPEPNRGRDTHAVTIPPGLRLSRWEVVVEHTSPGSGYHVVGGPKPGGDGRRQVTVEWWYGPYGRIAYRLQFFASPDGRGVPTPIYEGRPGWTEQMRDQMEQNLPITLAIQGPQAQALRAAIAEHPAARTAEPVTIIAIAVILSIVVVLGMLTLGALIKMAMEKGYDVKDSGYKAAAGSGETRQEHELRFNLRPPSPPAQQAGANDLTEWRIA